MVLLGLYGCFESSGTKKQKRKKKSVLSVKRFYSFVFSLLIFWYEFSIDSFLLGFLFFCSNEYCLCHSLSFCLRTVLLSISID